jgi:hypothetical protein
VITEVTEPTPKKTPVKGKAEEAAQPVSKPLAKGSKRLHGWDVLESSRLRTTISADKAMVAIS